MQGSSGDINTGMPQINKDKCDGCGICVTVCSCKALVIVDGKAAYDESHICSGCTRWCGNCELVCPKNAITCPFEIIVEE